MSPPLPTPIACYAIYRNGVFHQHVRDTESAVRNRMIALSNAAPDTFWSFELQGPPPRRYPPYLRLVIRNDV